MDLRPLITIATKRDITHNTALKNLKKLVEQNNSETALIKNGKGESLSNLTDDTLDKLNTLIEELSSVSSNLNKNLFEDDLNSSEKKEKKRKRGREEESSVLITSETEEINKEAKKRKKKMKKST